MMCAHGYAEISYVKSCIIGGKGLVTKEAEPVVEIW